MIEQRVSKKLNSFGGIPDNIPKEAADFVRDFFCAADTDNEADTDSDQDTHNDSEQTNTETNDIQSSSGRTVEMAITLAVFDQPLTNTALQSTESTYDDLSIKEDQIVQKFLEDGCGCERQCHKKFNSGVLINSQLDCAALDYYDANHVNHIHVILMGCLNYQTRDSKKIEKLSKHKETDHVLS